jgi:hypothetical protein
MPPAKIAHFLRNSEALPAPLGKNCPQKTPCGKTCYRPPPLETRHQRQKKKRRTQMRRLRQENRIYATKTSSAARKLPNVSGSIATGCKYFNNTRCYAHVNRSTAAGKI